MTIELTNRTDYADIYTIYTKDGKPIGTVEQRLAGRDVGTYFYPLTYKYGKRELRKIWGGFVRARYGYSD